MKGEKKQLKEYEGYIYFLKNVYNGHAGAIQCSQCKGSGVNSVDIFNGQFKAGDSCWLCG